MEEIDKVLDKTDKGDDVLRRFRFQITYACIASLTLLNDESQVKEIYCEHFEDILVKQNNNKYIGIQVKTRELSYGPFCIQDEQIIGCISKFSVIESLFGQQLDHYTIVTNVGFSVVKNKSLKEIIDIVKSGKEKEAIKKGTKILAFINSIEKRANVKKEVVCKVIEKLRLMGEAGNIDDISARLNDSLARSELLKNHTYNYVNVVSEKMLALVFNASSLTIDSNSYLNHVFGVQDEIKSKTIIEGKKISKEDLIKLIADSIADQVKLYVNSSPGLNVIPIGTKRLVSKMTAGGIEIENINLFKDHKFSAEKHFASWIHKYGSDEAELKYNQIRLIVANECQEAYDVFTGDDLFGKKMLIDIRQRLKKRQEMERSSFFDAIYEHLLGMSSILTEECTIWWSKKFDLEENGTF